MITGELMVLSRYNNLVWETKGYENDFNRWEGQANNGMGGKNLAEGTYYYIINLGKGKATYSGFVILKRN